MIVTMETGFFEGTSGLMLTTIEVQEIDPITKVLKLGMSAPYPIMLFSFQFSQIQPGFSALALNLFIHSWIQQQSTGMCQLMTSTACSPTTTKLSGRHQIHLLQVSTQALLHGGEVPIMRQMSRGLP
jgi:hypothetical protein